MVQHRDLAERMAFQIGSRFRLPGQDIDGHFLDIGDAFFRQRNLTLRT
jgi:hypothetical protein